MGKPNMTPPSPRPDIFHGAGMPDFGGFRDRMDQWRQNHPNFPSFPHPAPTPPVPTPAPQPPQAFPGGGHTGGVFPGGENGRWNRNPNWHDGMRPWNNNPHRGG